ncbi:hypothetical protein MKP05_14730 [Halomonas sp. EGI 63088]|uniref:Uncharacterized protein n=1 Tax=Halomonas flagellata TaxID=2920385 RepID=A0ABS9RWY8_9GAMM|nr:hypothetical protein [Halomonas flagellata]MCH4564363.1 hypothetical protein [Halomonas flagellata]
MTFNLGFDHDRTLDGCTFVDFHFDAPSYVEPVTLHGKTYGMTCSGKDNGYLYGSDLLGWDVVFGKRITADLIHGLAIPGVTFRVCARNGAVAADGFASLDAAKRFVAYLYERFYEAFYLGFDTYTATEAPAAQPAPSAQHSTVSPRSVPAPLARDVVPSPAPAPTRTTYRAAFYGTAVYPHLFKRNTP